MKGKSRNKVAPPTSRPIWPLSREPWIARRVMLCPCFDGHFKLTAQLTRSEIPLLRAGSHLRREGEKSQPSSRDDKMNFCQREEKTNAEPRFRAPSIILRYRRILPRAAGWIRCAARASLRQRAGDRGLGYRLI